MFNLFNIMRGYVRITVRGFFPERFLNICAKRGILLWDVSRKEKTCMSANVSIKGFRLLRPIAKKSRCTVKIEKRRGVPFFVYKYRKRKAFLLGAVLFGMIVYSMTMFIWVVDIKGNENISREKINDVLAKNGLCTGVLRFGIDSDKIKSDLMMEIPELAYISINLKGTTAEVEIREREVLPELFEKDMPSNIVASSGGVIEEIHTQSGMQLVKKGDVVVEGEVLVSGIVTAADGEFMRYENSEAEITARTWREYEIELPAIREERVQTGEQKTKHSVKIFNFNINFFIKDGISYQNYDIIESSNNLKLTKGIALPIVHNAKTYREIEILKKELSKDEAMSEHQKKLLEEEPGLEIVSVTGEENGTTLKITYECIENIAFEKNISQEVTNDNRESN